MSWQAYVDTNLVATEKVSKAAILGQQGGVWASSRDLELSPSEQQAVIAAFGNLDNTRSQGITLHGVKYFVLQAGDRSIYGKKAADGCVIVKTKQAILVAIYFPPIQQAECTKIVEALADYLIGVGY